MTVFVAHAQTEDGFLRASEIVSRLQRENSAHCFIPATIAFGHLYNGDFSEDEIFDIEADLLMNCDQMLIVGAVSAIMQRQIDYCHTIGMEVLALADGFRQV